MSLAERVNMMPFKCHDCECASGDYHLENCSVVKQFSRKPDTNQLHLFDTEIATITQRRGDVYGHPLDDFRTASDLMSHFDHVAPVEVRHALRMICVKLARLTNTPNHIDSYVDIVGYARCAVMVLDKYARSKNSA